MLEKAFSLETNYPGNWEFQLAHSHLLLRQYDEAITRLNRAVERIPKSYIPLVMLAWVYAELDRLAPRRVETLSYRPQYELYYWPLAIALLVSLLYFGAVEVRSRLHRPAPPLESGMAP